MIIHRWPGIKRAGTTTFYFSETSIENAKLSFEFDLEFDDSRLSHLRVLNWRYVGCDSGG